MDNAPLDGLLAILRQRLFNGAEQFEIVSQLINKIADGRSIRIRTPTGDP
jgi:hypothetical protein